MTDPVAAQYITNKGWTNPADVIKSYQGAEKLIGRDPTTLLTIPRADDPVGFRAAMARLGMPETADKYDFKMPEGADPTYGEWAKGTFHKVGLTASQAKELVAANNEFAAQAQAASQKAYDLQVSADKQTLLTEWRGGYERMMTAAQTAVKSLGFSAEMIDAMEKTVGYANVMKHFAALGQKLGEDSFVSSGEGKGQRFSGTMTPSEAQAQINADKLDPNTKMALFDTSHPGHKAAKERQSQLFALAYPG